MFMPSGRVERFWDGVLRRPHETIEQFYRKLDRAPGSVFPITFAAAEGATTGLATGNVEGLYSRGGLLGRLKISR